MKITNQELDLLIDEFKKLVRHDLNGITASDARNTIYDWLKYTGNSKKAVIFEQAILEFQLSDEIMGAE